MFQVFSASLSINTYVLMDVEMQELLFYMFDYQGYLASISSDSRFLQLVFDSNSRGKAKLPYGMSVPAAFTAKLYFHALALLCRQEGVKNLNVMLNAGNAPQEGIAIQVVQKA